MVASCTRTGGHMSGSTGRHLAQSERPAYRLGIERRRLYHMRLKLRRAPLMPVPFVSIVTETDWLDGVKLT